jgi:hypothetical protein
MGRVMPGPAGASRDVTVGVSSPRLPTTDMSKLLRRIRRHRRASERGVSFAGPAAIAYT